MAELNLVHRVRVPQKHRSSLLPAVVLVHGWQGDENVMWIFERTLPAGVLAISPRGPVPVEGSYGWFADRAAGADYAAGLDALREFVVRLPEVHPVDPARVVMMGFSQGAAMSYALALKEPDLAAAGAALAGFLPPFAQAWVEPGRLAGKPFFITHGTEDESVPVEDARRARAALERAGARVTYHEHEVGHKLNAQGMRELKAWFAQNVPSA